MILGYKVPPCDQEIRDGIFTICFRGHPFLDPFETSPDGTAHATPFLRVALDYTAKTYGTLPTGFAFITLFKTVPGQIFGQDWTLRNERPRVGLVRGSLDDLKGKTAGYRKLKAGNLYETGVTRVTNQTVATFAFDRSNKNLAKLNYCTQQLIWLFAVTNHPNYRADLED